MKLSFKILLWNIYFAHLHRFTNPDESISFLICFVDLDQLITLTTSNNSIWQNSTKTSLDLVNVVIGNHNFQHIPQGNLEAGDSK